MEPLTLDTMDRAAIDACFEDILVAYEEADKLFNRTLDAGAKRSASRIKQSIELCMNRVAFVGIHTEANWEQVKSKLSEGNPN